MDGDLLLATVDQLDGYRVDSYHGVISVHVSCGINFVRGWFVALRDLVGGKVGTFENEAVRLEERAKRELWERIRQMPDVNAVIGLQFTYHHIGQQRKSMLALTVSGTACHIRAAGSQHH
ncbi:MAG: heavy metal-binding domain-containing protein [Nitrospirota bacterium]